MAVEKLAVELLHGFLKINMMQEQHHLWLLTCTNVSVHFKQV